MSCRDVQYILIFINLNVVSLTATAPKTQNLILTIQYTESIFLPLPRVLLPDTYIQHQQIIREIHSPNKRNYNRGNPQQWLNNAGTYQDTI